MNVLITGSSGFLGRRIREEAKAQGYNYWGLNRSKDSDISCDLAIDIPELLNLPALDLVVHAAGKAHITPRTEEQKEEFKRVNEIGTENFLFGLEQKLPKRIVFISTVAVYGQDQGEEIDEDHILAGESAYASSKIKAERLVEAWALKHQVDYFIFRLPLISGQNPPGNLGAMASAIRAGWYLRMGEGDARKSMVGSGDVARLILDLEEAPSGVYNLCDGIHPSIADIDTAIAKIYKRKIQVLPPWSLRFVNSVFRTFKPTRGLSEKIDKMNNTLTFNDAKARRQLNWKPNPAIQDLFFSE